MHPWWKQLVSTSHVSLEEYEKEVNEFCKTVKVISITPLIRNGIILHVVVYEEGGRYQ